MTFKIDPLRKLPIDVKVGNTTFKKGVQADTAIRCIERFVKYANEDPEWNKVSDEDRETIDGLINTPAFMQKGKL